MSADDSTELDERPEGWLGPLLIAAVFVALATCTWGTWPDVLIDFGREAYVPWRIVEGDVLYRDIAWFNGPLSPCVNALWFLIGGAGLRTLFVANLALLALLTVLVYRLLRELSDSLIAMVGCVVMLAMFGFGQLVGIGNYNFVAPYSHEATHGVILGVGELLFLGAWARTRGQKQLAAAGFCAGLALLTKPEVAFAAVVTGPIVVLLSGRVAPVIAEYGRAAFVFLAGALLPLVVAVLGIAAFAGWGPALAGLLAPWKSLFASDAATLPFYRTGMGLDHPLQRLHDMLVATGLWIAVLAPAIGLAFALRGHRLSRRGPALALFGIYVAVLLALDGRIHWLAAAKPLPIVALATIASAWWQGRREVERAPLALAFAVYALALMGKMILNPRVQHYGFALALPATLLALFVLACWLPAWIDARGGRGALVRAGALGMFVAAAAAHLWITKRFVEHKTEHPIAGVNDFRADVRGKYVREALVDLLGRVGPDTSIAVLPEGVMINFLLYSRNPTPYVNFMPPELMFFGEDAMLASFQRQPPDLIVLVHKDTSEYGFPLFGRDYGQKLMAWVRAGYAPAKLIGDVPLEPDSRFGIQILLERRPDPGGGSH